MPTVPEIKLDDPKDLLELPIVNGWMNGAVAHESNVAAAGIHRKAARSSSDVLTSKCNTRRWPWATFA